MTTQPLLLPDRANERFHHGDNDAIAAIFQADDRLHTLGLQNLDHPSLQHSLRSLEEASNLSKVFSLQTVHLPNVSTTSLPQPLLLPTLSGVPVGLRIPGKRPAPAQYDHDSTEQPQQPVAETTQLSPQQQQQQRQQQQSIFDVALEQPAPKKQIIEWDRIHSHTSDGLQDSVRTIFVSEQGAAAFDKLYKRTYEDEFSAFVTSSAFDNASVRDEPHLIHCISQLLLGSPSDVFRLVQHEETAQPLFVLNDVYTELRVTDVSRGSLQQCIESFLDCGTHVVRLENVVATVRDNPAVFGSTGLSFAAALGDVLQYVRGEYINMVDEEHGFTLGEAIPDHPAKDPATILPPSAMRLSQIIGPMKQLLERLALLCCCDAGGIGIAACSSSEASLLFREFGFVVFKGAKQLAILSDVLTIMCNVDVEMPLVVNAIKYLLERTSEPLISWINGLIGNGNGTACINDDPYHEFFVSERLLANGNVTLDFAATNLPLRYVDIDFARELIMSSEWARLLHMRHALAQESTLSVTSPATTAKSLFTQPAVALMNYDFDNAILIDDNTGTNNAFAQYIESNITDATRLPSRWTIFDVSPAAIESSISRMRQIREDMLAWTLDEMRLADFIELVCSTILLQNGTFAQKLVDILFASTRRGRPTASSAASWSVESGGLVLIDGGIAELRSTLGELIDQVINNWRRHQPQQLTCSASLLVSEEDIARLKRSHDANTLQSCKFDFVRFDFTLPVPINAVVDPSVLSKLNSVLQLMLRLERTNRLLNDGFLALLKIQRGAGNAECKSASILHTKMRHILASLQSFVSNNVVHTAHSRLLSVIRNVDSARAHGITSFSHVKDLISVYATVLAQRAFTQSRTVCDTIAALLESMCVFVRYVRMQTSAAEVIDKERIDEIGKQLDDHVHRLMLLIGQYSSSSRDDCLTTVDSVDTKWAAVLLTGNTTVDDSAQELLFMLAQPVAKK
ncbi:hypothetical protein GQ42DRAFT_163869 [Ramicandelaber brevisporus]|nr:hypothetical protein GQ42DRAFT_163869 [Ramicandelaber brevisporus]